MSEHRTFIKSIALVAIAMLITNLRGLILLPLLTKMIGAAGYGIWSQVLITVALLAPFMILGLTSSTVRFLSAEKDSKKVSKGIFTVMFTVLFVSIFFALILFLFSDFFASTFLQDSSVSFFIKLTLLLLILEALNQTSLASFRIFGQIKKYSVLTILQTVLEIILIATAILSGFGLSGAIVALLIVRAIILSFALYSIISHIGFTAPDFSLLRPYLIFGLPILPIGFFDILINSSDRYIIGFFKGASAVGIYSATYNIGLLAVVFIYPIAYILSPTIFKLFDEGNVDKVKMYLSYSLKYFLLFSIPSIFGLTILARILLKTLTTSEFILPNTMFIILWVASSSIFLGVHAIYGQILLLQKNTKFYMVAFGIGVAVNVVLNIIFVPYFGVIAAAVTTLLAYLVVGLLVYFKSIQYITFKVDFIFIAKSVLASLGMAGFIFVSNPIGTIKILLAIVIGALIYFFLLCVFKGFGKKELEVISQMLKLKPAKEELLG